MSSANEFFSKEERTLNLTGEGAVPNRMRALSRIRCTHRFTMDIAAVDVTTAWKLSGPRNEVEIVSSRC
jgi:hypothetical protein